MKRCLKCGVEKPLKEFYAHPQMADGHLNKCKDCTKADAANYWHEHAAILRQTDLARRKVRRQANVLVGNALRDGRLTKPAVCHYCRELRRLFAHHWNYYRPLDVTWLCRRCHLIADMARRDAEVFVALQVTA